MAIAHSGSFASSLHALPFAADTTHYLENECMREAMEGVLYQNGVDVILNGHLHEYERTNPVYVSTLAATLHVGCAGTLVLAHGFACCESVLAVH